MYKCSRAPGLFGHVVAILWTRGSPAVDVVAKSAGCACRHSAAHYADEDLEYEQLSTGVKVRLAFGVVMFTVCTHILRGTDGCRGVQARPNCY